MPTYLLTTCPHRVCPIGTSALLQKLKKGQVINKEDLSSGQGEEKKKKKSSSHAADDDDGDDDDDGKMKRQ